jgi:hypothetical protein
LAVIAISGLAVTGIPALAMADTIDSQVTPVVGATDVQLYNDNTSFSGPTDLTAKNDGTDSTVRLEAGAGVNVPSVTFQVSRNGGAYADIATVASRNDDGAFSHEWNPADNGAFPGDAIDLRVVNAADITEDDTENGFTLRLASAVNTQAINIAAGEQKGYFEDPDNLTEYTLGVAGTTTVTSTATIDRPCISWQDGGANDEDGTCDTSNGGDGTWEGTLRFSDATYTLDDPTLPPAEADQMVVRAQTDTVLAPDDQTDDFEAFTLYEQTLTSLTATITPAEEPDPGVVTVTVLDQNSNPIAGIEVFEAGGAFAGTTDGRGQLAVEQDDTVQYYYANADSPDAFSPAAGDKRSPDVQNLAANVSIVTSPSDGPVALGTAVTETITVTDANGDPISNRAVRVRRNGPGGQAETVFMTTNTNGVVTYNFTCNVAGVTSIAVGIFGPNPPDPFDPYTFATATDNVTCGIPPKSAIDVRLRGKNRGNKDVLRVNGPTKAAGAVVRLQKKTANGWKNISQAKVLNSVGNKKFVVRDKNGNKVTKYRAKVAATVDTKADTSNVVRRR